MSDLILEKYARLPDDIKKQVLDYIEFLEAKYKGAKSSLVSEKKESNFGSAIGQIIMHDDFDEPLEGFKPYM